MTVYLVVDSGNHNNPLPTGQGRIYDCFTVYYDEIMADEAAKRINQEVPDAGGMIRVAKVSINWYEV
jgi:hypothetical protein